MAVAYPRLISITSSNKDVYAKTKWSLLEAKLAVIHR